MATGTEEAGFGRVSRLRGLVFQYATFLASVAGIVSLGVLLAFVGWDAFGLDAASAAWYAAFFALVVAPVVGFVVWARTHETASTVAWISETRSPVRS